MKKGLISLLFVIPLFGCFFSSPSTSKFKIENVTFYDSKNNTLQSKLCDYFYYYPLITPSNNLAKRSIKYNSPAPRLLYYGTAISSYEDVKVEIEISHKGYMLEGITINDKKYDKDDIMGVYEYDKSIVSLTLNDISINESAFTINSVTLKQDNSVEDYKLYVRGGEKGVVGFFFYLDDVIYDDPYYSFEVTSNNAVLNYSFIKLIWYGFDMEPNGVEYNPTNYIENNLEITFNSSFKLSKLNVTIYKLIDEEFIKYEDTPLTFYYGFLDNNKITYNDLLKGLTEDEINNIISDDENVYARLSLDFYIVNEDNSFEFNGKMYIDGVIKI